MSGGEDNGTQTYNNEIPESKFIATERISARLPTHGHQYRCGGSKLPDEKWGDRE